MAKKKPVKASYKLPSLNVSEKGDKTVVVARRPYVLRHLIYIPWTILLAFFFLLIPYIGWFIIVPACLFVIAWLSWYVVTGWKKLVFTPDGLEWKGKLYAWEDFNGFRETLKPLKIGNFNKDRIGFQYGTQEFPIVDAKSEYLEPQIVRLNAIARRYVGPEEEWQSDRSEERHQAF